MIYVNLQFFYLERICSDWIGLFPLILYLGWIQVTKLVIQELFMFRVCLKHLWVFLFFVQCKGSHNIWTGPQHLNGTVSMAENISEDAAEEARIIIFP